VAACGSGGSTGKAAVGTTAPGFATSDVNGNRVRLADFSGHPVLVNFWASWCIPCRTEFPVLRSLTAAHPDVKVLGVVFKDSASDARKFLDEQHATWPGLLDPKGQIADAYGVHQKPGIPVTVLVDGSGVVRARHLGPITSVADAETLLATPSGK
jgi:cytochrome c biogenesis protein CcmG/thiol:disulfide interchange protein DsbE